MPEIGYDVPPRTWAPFLPRSHDCRNNHPRRCIHGVFLQVHVVPGHIAGGVAERVVAGYDAGANHPERIQGWYNLAGGGAGFLLVDDDASEDRDVLEAHTNGPHPAGWAANRPTTREEARLLSPLDRIVAGNRYRAVFAFSHTWELYKPAETRAYGPYTMPLLYGDVLIGRMDAKLDRDAGTLRINGVWLESVDVVSDDAVLPALAAGTRAFAEFLDATSIDLTAIITMVARHDVVASRPPGGQHPDLACGSDRGGPPLRRNLSGNRSSRVKGTRIAGDFLKRELG